MHDNQKSKDDLLQQVPLFCNISKNNLKELVTITDEVKKNAGAILAQQGDVGQEFVLIIEGEARVERDSQTINRLTTGDFFGEISVIDLHPRTASVVAETDVRLLVVHSRHFIDLIRKVPDLAIEVMTTLCKYVRDANSDSI